MRRRTFPYRPLSIRRLPKKCTTSPNRTLQLPSFGRRPRTRRGHGAASGGDDDAGDRDPLRRAQPLAEAEETRERGGRRRSEEHTSELQSLMHISYAVFCLKTKTKHQTTHITTTHISE